MSKNNHNSLKEVIETQAERIKSVGVITFNDTRNYGAVLQMFALQCALKKLGYQPQVIDYHNMEHYYGDISFFKKCKHSCWRFCVDYIIAAKRWNKTIKFIKERVTLTPHCYRTYSELNENPPVFDFYITGSDQVWNPAWINNDPAFFLDFAPNDLPRISYAASFGVSKLPQPFLDKYRTWLKKFHVCSVREDAGVDLFEKIGVQTEPQVLLDPVFLVDKNEWSKLTPTITIEESYLLCYVMPGDKNVERELFNKAAELASLNNLKVVYIGLKEYNRFKFIKNAIWNAGPQDFVNLIKNASFVVTNSFHGTAFSIIFHRQFCSLCNNHNSAKIKLSSRLESLLSKCGLGSQLIDIASNKDTDFMQKIDYSKVDDILNTKIAEAKSFLKESMK